MTSKAHFSIPALAVAVTLVVSTSAAMAFGINPGGGGGTTVGFPLSNPALSGYPQGGDASPWSCNVGNPTSVPWCGPTGNQGGADCGDGLPNAGFTGDGAINDTDVVNWANGPGMEVCQALCNDGGYGSGSGTKATGFTANGATMNCTDKNNSSIKGSAPATGTIECYCASGSVL